MFARIKAGLRGENWHADRMDAMVAQYSMTHDLDEYQYEALPTLSSIRLLVLDPPRKEYQNKLMGSIVVAELGSIKGAYYAVSYVWGDPAPTQEIIIKGSSTRVRINENLHRTLYDLARSPRAKSGVWADAVCIDQKNIPERNQQVNLMGQIYSSAMEVYVCLRTSGPELERLNRFLLRLTRLIQRPLKRRLEHVGHANAIPNQTEYGFPEPDSPDWQILRTIREDPWFGRCWTLQESLLAKRLTVSNDSYKKEFDLALLADVETMLLKLGVITGQDPFSPTHQRYQQRILALDRLKTKPQIHLIELLSLCATQEATDERDLLYSLLGLAEEGQAPELAADYNESVEEARIRYAKYLVKRGYGNSLLHMCFDMNSRAQLPSWVPQKISAGCTDDRYRSKYAEPRVSDNVHIRDEDHNILAVRGQNFGTIEQVGKLIVDAERLNSEETDESLAELTHVWHIEAMELLSQTPQLFTTDWPVDAYTISWQLLWAGHGNLQPGLQFVDDMKEMTTFAQFMRWKQQLGNGPAPSGLEDRLSELETMLQMYMAFLPFESLACKRLFRTGVGLVGLSDLTTAPGDILFSPDGEAVKVLRPLKDKGSDSIYRIIGFAAMYRPELIGNMRFGTEEIYIA